MLQAAIAAHHARAVTAEATEWPRIAALYTLLAQRAPSPIVELNRAVAIAMAFGPDAGLELVDALVADGALAAYHLLPAVRGDLLAKLGRGDEARAEFQRAAELTRNERERDVLLARARRAGGAPRRRLWQYDRSVEFSSAHAFRRLQALALLQGFDGGTFARLHEEVFPAADMAELLGPRIIDDTQIRAIVASYYQRHPEVALRARVLVLVKPLTTDELRRRGCAFLSALELATPGDFAPTSIGEVADAIQNALILARRRERVWAVNDTAPFFVVRDDVDEEYGELWQPPRPMLTRFADLIRAGDEAIRVLDKQVIGGITVHTYASNGEGVVLVTDGFRMRSLSGPSDDLVRLELVTYAWCDARHVAGRLVALGNALYDHPPIAPGAAVSADGTRYLVSMFGDVQATFEGDIQFTRVTPLAAGELDVADDDEGWAFLDELGLAAAMSRW